MRDRIVHHARLLDMGFGAIALAPLLTEWINPLAGGASLLWFGIQIWESKTGHYWRMKLRNFLIRKGPL